MARREVIVAHFLSRHLHEAIRLRGNREAGRQRAQDDRRAGPLAGNEPVSALAARHGVSRPLVYRQMRKASAALDELFSTEQADDQDKVLFSLPVTKRWLEQATLALTMIAHASMRGVVEFMHDVLGVSISLGTVHNIHRRAAQRAFIINDRVELSAIRVGLHDALFQGSAARARRHRRRLDLLLPAGGRRASFTTPGPSICSS